MNFKLFVNTPYTLFWSIKIMLGTKDVTCEQISKKWRCQQK